MNLEQSRMVNHSVTCRGGRWPGGGGLGGGVEGQDGWPLSFNNLATH
jgi:hypothetical protein